MSIHTYTALRLDDHSVGFTADPWEPRAIRIEADHDTVIVVHLTNSTQVRDALNVLRGIEDHFAALDQADTIAADPNVQAYASRRQLFAEEIRRDLDDDDRYFNQDDDREVA